MRSNCETFPVPVDDTALSFRALAATVAAVAAGLAIQQHDGEYSPRAIALITLALAAGVLAVRLPRTAASLKIAPRVVQAGLVLAITIQLLCLAFTWPAGVDQQAVSSANRAIYEVRLIVAAMFVVLGASEIAFARRWWFVGLVAAHLWLSVWMIRSSPNPHIDVWEFQQRGPEALLHGRNPYDPRQAQFPDIYHSTRPGAQEVYGPGMSKDGVLQFGFPYPPLSLLLSTAGYWIAGDCRYAQAAAMVLAALFLGCAAPGNAAKLGAALLLFTPRIFFIIGRGWTEPFVVMLLAATVFCAARRSRALPMALGLFLASKQYLVFAVPLTFLLLPRPFDIRSRESWTGWLRLLSGAALAAAAVTLPLALWNWRQFWFSAVTVQQIAPFRWDALSYLVFLGLHNSYYTRWVWMAFVAMLAAMGCGIWKGPRSAAGFAATVGLVFLAFFAFNKQAFCNYYFFTLGAFCSAIAASGPTSGKSGA